MLVSIIISTLNRENDLCEALSYFLNEEKYRPLEVLVIEQSMKESPKVAAMEEPFSLNGIKMNYIIKKFENQYAAINYGVSLSQGEVVLIIDDDTIPKEGFISGHILPYSDSKVKSVTGPIIRPGQYLKGREDFGEKLYNDIITGRRIAWCADFGYYPGWAPGGNISFRKVFFQDIGGYDENFYGGVPVGSDSEIWLRVKKAGGILYYSPRAALIHKQVPYGGCRNLKKGKDFFFKLLYNRNYLFLKKQEGGRKRRHRVIWRVFRNEILNRNIILKRPLSLPLLTFYFFIGLIKSNKRLAKDLG